MMELATARSSARLKWRTSVMICEALRRRRRVDARVRIDRGPIRDGWSALRATRDRALVPVHARARIGGCR